MGLDDAAAGMEAARKAIVAIAEGDESAALATLNSTTHAEAVWCSAYLLSCLREAIGARVGFDPRRMELALKAGASATAEDTVVTQVGLIVQDEDRRT